MKPERVRLFVDGRLLVMQVINLVALGFDLLQRLGRGMMGGDQLISDRRDLIEIGLILGFDA